MGSWIARRAQTDPSLAASAKILSAEADAFWSALRAVLEQNIAEFNALYGDRPERLAEFSADNGRATIRLKQNPDVFADVSRDELRLVCRFGSRQRSRLAAEFRIFGDWDTTRVLTFTPQGAGIGAALPGGAPMDVAAAAEFVLAPVLFPA